MEKEGRRGRRPTFGITGQGEATNHLRIGRVAAQHFGNTHVFDGEPLGVRGEDIDARAGNKRGKYCLEA